MPTDPSPIRPRLRAAELRALERVFDAEIHDRLPFQSKAKVYKDLTRDGYVETMDRRFGHGPLSVIVTGYTLTHLGCMTYCASCESAKP